jgi:hypothetical protein
MKTKSSQLWIQLVVHIQFIISMALLSGCSLNSGGYISHRRTPESVIRSISSGAVRGESAPPNPRIGPARLTQQRVAVVFAQNKRHRPGSQQSDVCGCCPTQYRSPWREVEAIGRVARTFCSRHASCLEKRSSGCSGSPLRPSSLIRAADLRDEPERRRIARAAERWGVADRVRFEGQRATRRTPCDSSLLLVRYSIRRFTMRPVSLSPSAVSFGTRCVSRSRGSPDTDPQCTEAARHRHVSSCSNGIDPIAKSERVQVPMLRVVAARQTLSFSSSITNV